VGGEAERQIDGQTVKKKAEGWGGEQAWDLGDREVAGRGEPARSYGDREAGAGVAARRARCRAGRSRSSARGVAESGGTERGRAERRALVAGPARPPPPPALPLRSRARGRKGGGERGSGREGRGRLCRRSAAWPWPAAWKGLEGHRVPLIAKYKTEHQGSGVRKKGGRGRVGKGKAKGTR
jgi:hypothetical protein